MAELPVNSVHTPLYSIQTCKLYMYLELGYISNNHGYSVICVCVSVCLCV